MPPRRKHAPLGVFLNGRLVGRLNRERSGAIDFRYDAGWLAWEHALPVSLSLPLREDRYIGPRTVAAFDNLLPDSQPIRRRIAERVGADGTDAYSLLAAIGRDCVGALQFLPDGDDPGEAGSVHGHPVSAGEIARLLSALSARPLGLGESADFRISIAGTQEKTALLRWRNRWHKPAGTTATTHILKPQIGRLANGIDLSHSVENEYLCLKLAAALGIPSADARIETFEDTPALVVERFDRRWTHAHRKLLRLPQEDCCQALSVPPERKYEAEAGPGIAAILALLQGSDEPEADRATFLKSQILFWLIGATDGHAKNVSIHLWPGGRFRLTPLYDVLSAQPSVDAGQIRRNRMKLAMAVGDGRHYAVARIAPRHFFQTAAGCGVGAGVVRRVLDDIRAAADAAIDRTLAALPTGFPEAVAAAIVGGMRRRLQSLDRAKA